MAMMIDNTKIRLGKATVTTGQFSNGQVTSANGTFISSRQKDSGPGLIIMYSGYGVDHVLTH